MFVIFDNIKEPTIPILIIKAPTLFGIVWAGERFASSGQIG